MNRSELTDNEVAATLDSLAFMRDEILRNTPDITPNNIKSALKKFTSIVERNTARIVLEAYAHDEEPRLFSHLEDRDLEIVSLALEGEQENWSADAEELPRVKKLYALSRAEVESRPALVAKYEGDDL